MTEKFDSKNLEHLKEKGTYPYEYMDSFKRFNEEKLPDKECFYRSVKDRKTGEKLGGYISDEEYLTCKKIWDVFKIEIMGWLCELPPPSIFLRVLYLLVVINCSKLRHETWENGKKPNFESNLACLAQIWASFLNFLQALPLLVVRHCSKLSSYAN